MSCTWITYSDKKNHNDFKRRLFLGKHLWSENPRPGSPIPQLQTWQQTPNRRQENQLLSHPFPHLILITAQWARQIQLGPFYRLGKQAQRVLATWLNLNSETLLELGLKPCPWDPAWHHPSCRWPLLALRARSGRREGRCWEGKGGADFQALCAQRSLAQPSSHCCCYTGLSAQETEVSAGRPGQGFDLHIYAQLVCSLLGASSVLSQRTSSLSLSVLLFTISVNLKVVFLI